MHVLRVFLPPFDNVDLGLDLNAANFREESSSQTGTDKAQ
jgi:hypothetical protein